MGELGRLIEEWRGAQPYPPSDRRVAIKLDVSPTTFGKWLQGQRPEPLHLAALAREMNYPYRRLVDAMLTDAGYLPEPDMARDVQRIKHARAKKSRRSTIDDSSQTG